MRERQRETEKERGTEEQREKGRTREQVRGEWQSFYCHRCDILSPGLHSFAHTRVSVSHRDIHTWRQLSLRVLVEPAQHTDQVAQDLNLSREGWKVLVDDNI